MARKPGPPIFGDDPDRRNFVVEADLLAPDVTLAEGARVIAVRTGFLRALVMDPRIERLFASWVTELEKYAAAAAKVGADAKDPVFEVEPLLKDLKVPYTWWPWCYVELGHTFQRMITHKIADPAQALPASGEAAVLAPPMLTFATEEGESTDESREHLRALVAHAETALMKAEEDAGGRRAPKDDQGYLRTWGRWFYEARIRRPPRTIAELAAENHAARAHRGGFVVGATRSSSDEEEHDCQ